MENTCNQIDIATGHNMRDESRLGNIKNAIERGTNDFEDVCSKTLSI